MADALRTILTRQTPQRERADERQRRNAAGGFVFSMSAHDQMHRFLTMGISGPTFYVGERELAHEAADLVRAYISAHGERLVSTIVDISTTGRAPRPNAAIFALAAASALGDDATRSKAYDALPAVCRTGFQLFLWAQYRSQFAGVSRGYRRAVGGWYTNKPIDKLAYQMVKYRQREGWDHRRLIDLTHPTPDGPARDMLFRWAKGLPRSTADKWRTPPAEDVHIALLDDYLDAQRATTTAAWVEIINRGHGISWEMLPDEALTQAAVWASLIEHGLPMTALLRNLPRLTRLGLARGAAGTTIRAQLTDAELLKRGRIHPLNVLTMAKTYAGGQGRGGSWEPDIRTIDALDECFYAAFGAVEPAGRKMLVALDVSGSMAQSQCSGMANLTPREAAAALSLVTMRTEPDYEVIGFTGGRAHSSGYALGKSGSNEPAVSRLTLSTRQRLDDVLKYTDALPFGPTDCSLPMLWALNEGYRAETFVIYTDNQTWIGPVHPHQALRRYREATGIAARLIVVGMAGPLWTSIADPNDALSLDVSGFDAAVPVLINDFSRGEL